ncbi:MAG: hypothetical protein KGV54_00210 [Oceanivirga sp.]|nr:hypothetical protein [Oceanivirga sp.]
MNNNGVFWLSNFYGDMFDYSWDRLDFLVGRNTNNNCDEYEKIKELN